MEEACVMGAARRQSWLAVRGYLWPCSELRGLWKFPQRGCNRKTSYLLRGHGAREENQLTLVAVVATVSIGGSGIGYKAKGEWLSLAFMPQVGCSVKCKSISS